jgi:hypothetical protein
MLAQELTRLRLEQADEEVTLLRVDPAADPAGRRAVVGGLDFHAAKRYQGAHPPLVTREIFACVQAVLRREPRAR